MKKYNGILGVCILCYLVLAAVTYFMFSQEAGDDSKMYLVEINRMMDEINRGDVQIGQGEEIEQGEEAEQGGEVKQGGIIEVGKNSFIKKITFLSALEKDSSTEKIRDFYESKNGLEYVIKPYYKDGVLEGYYRFDYQYEKEKYNLVWYVEMILFVVIVLVISSLIYIKKAVIKPFHNLSNMPYELAKGHVNGKLEESKSRYFGRFVWGMTMLGDHLESHQKKELQLEKEKKLMLLSISHDIKTPLNTIKLYARALEEGIYKKEEKKKEAAHKIGLNCIEIENFVKEIMKSSSEDILEITVHKGEFYLFDLLDKVRKQYEGKCKLLMTDFCVDDVSNKLLLGDIERSVEAIGNIIENALKYGDGRRIEVSFSNQDYCQLIHITNTGNVIQSNEITHIFDSFYRGSNVNHQQGNGLGLYICKEIMKKMDGDIYAEQGEDTVSIILVFRM